MQREQWNRPSCLIMLAVLVLLLGVLGWLAFGGAPRTPSAESVTRETPTYDTDVPSPAPPSR